MSDMSLQEALHKADFNTSKLPEGVPSVSRVLAAEVRALQGGNAKVHHQLKQLQAENERLTTSLGISKIDVQTLAAALALCEQQRDQLNSCEVDAKRYQYLRDKYSASASRKWSEATRYHDLLWVPQSQRERSDIGSAMDCWVDAQMQPLPLGGSHG